MGHRFVKIRASLFTEVAPSVGNKNQINYMVNLWKILC
jgi:hypothetical protein